MGLTLKSLSCALAFGMVVVHLRADVLVGTNGERFVGTVIEQTTNSIVFDSELAGRLTFPQAKIHELRRTMPLAADHRSLITADVSNVSTNPA